MKIVFCFFLYIYSQCGTPAFLATQHTTMCLDLSALLQFAVSTDCSIREYQSIFMELNLKYPPNFPTLCSHSTPAYYAGIIDAGLITNSLRIY